MKVYSDKINGGQVQEAFLCARQLDGQDIWLDGMRSFNPRKTVFRSGTEFWARSLNGKVASGHRPVGSYPLSLENGSGVARAASWSAYGYVIARLYLVDPDAKIGKYGNAQDFMDQVRAHVPRGQHTRFLELLGHEEEA